MFCEEDTNGPSDRSDARVYAVVSAVNSTLYEGREGTYRVLRTTFDKFPGIFQVFHS